jgi:hypothetical protein
MVIEYKKSLMNREKAKQAIKRISSNYLYKKQYILITILPTMV